MNSIVLSPTLLNAPTFPIDGTAHSEDESASGEHSTFYEHSVATSTACSEPDTSSNTTMLFNGKKHIAFLSVVVRECSMQMSRQLVGPLFSKQWWWLSLET